MLLVISKCFPLVFSLQNRRAEWRNFFGSMAPSVTTTAISSNLSVSHVKLSLLHTCYICSKDIMVGLMKSFPKQTEHKLLVVFIIMTCAKHN